MSTSSRGSRLRTAALSLIGLGSLACGQAMALSIAVQGNRLVDASGSVVQLRGVNYSGFEFTAVQGWSPSDPSGNQAGPGGPDYRAIKSWGANVIRIPLNEASWLGGTCVDTSGKRINPDPGGNYRSAIASQVQAANAAGIYVILDLHWAAPSNSCPMLQTQMADADNSLRFWSSIASTYKNNPAVMFELYNEPYTWGLASGEQSWPTLMQGGTFTYYAATSAAGNWQQYNAPWKVASFQDMINTIRSVGATNVVIVGGDEYDNNMSGWLANKPGDGLNQLAASWHPYPPQQSLGAVTVASGGSGYAAGDTITLVKPNTVYSPAVLEVRSVGSGGAVTAVSISDSGAYLQTSLPTTAVAQGSTSGSGNGATFRLTQFNNLASQWSMPANWPAVQQIAAKVPVLLTELGEQNAPGTTGAPFLQQLLPWADGNGISYLGWTWDVWAGWPVLIKDAGGTPTDGFGQYFHDHLKCRASGSSDCGGSATPAPAASLSPTALTYASQTVGTASAAQTVTLSNTGTASLNISGVTVSGDFSQTSTCGTLLAAGAKCSFNVSFKPTASGARTGSLRIASNASSSPSTVNLSGTGATSAPEVSLSPDSLTYASQTVGTTSAAQVVSLSNNGSSPLSISGVTVSGDFAQSNRCGSLLAAGAKCSFNVSFKPTASGARTGSLRIASNASSSPSTVSLSGTGATSAPEVSLSPNPLRFANQTVGTAGTAQTVTLSNNGSSPLSISGVTVSGDFAQSNRCGSSLAAGAKCSFSVRFQPTASGTRIGTLRIASNASISASTVILIGTGATSTSTNYPQPVFSGYSPVSGPVGTVITVTGSGFTGVVGAQIGNAKDVAFTVINDTTLEMTVPADATTAQFAVWNPKKTAWSPYAFIVTR